MGKDGPNVNKMEKITKEYAEFPFLANFPQFLSC